jgi:hypothetical protein
MKGWTNFDQIFNNKSSVCFFLHPQKHRVLPQKTVAIKINYKSLQIKKSVDMKYIISPKIMVKSVLFTITSLGKNTKSRKLIYKRCFFLSGPQNISTNVKIITSNNKSWVFSAELSLIFVRNIN